MRIRHTQVIQGIEAVHATEGAITGIPENQSGNDLDRLCFLTEDRVILGEPLQAHSFIADRFATLPSISVTGCSGSTSCIIRKR